MRIGKYSKAQERAAYAERQCAAGECAASRLAALLERVEADLRLYRADQSRQRNLPRRPRPDHQEEPWV